MKPFKVALLNNIKRWSFAFKKHLVSMLKNFLRPEITKDPNKLEWSLHNLV
jgi:hypothetical protein